MKRITLSILAALAVVCCSKPEEDPVKEDSKDYTPTLSTPLDGKVLDLSSAKSLAFKWTVKDMSQSFDLLLYPAEGETALKSYKTNNTQYTIPVAELKTLMEDNASKEATELDIRWAVRAINTSGAAISETRSLKLSWPDRNDEPEGVRNMWYDAADSLTTSFIDNYMVKNKGCFKNRTTDSGLTSGSYWQMAHAINVINYAYKRVKPYDPTRAEEYKTYMERYFANNGNNYNNSHKSDGKYGCFFNQWTDDMAWVCITLLNFSETLEDDQYADVAKQVYDNYMITRLTTNDKGYVGLPWTNREEDKNKLNGCTNAPACEVACRLYNKYGTASYLDDAKILFNHMYNDVYVQNGSTGMLGDPPLTYTQGAFAEACRYLYHITKEDLYINVAYSLLKYAYTSRCSSNYTTPDGKTVKVLRSEGVTMDQALFKAVLIPNTVNFILDKDIPQAQRDEIKGYLIINGQALRRTLDHSKDQIYACYFWGFTWDQWALTDKGKTELADRNCTIEQYTPNMSCQASGASLLEGLARLPE